MSIDATTFTYDFFVSRRGTVADVAREVTDVLKAEHYEVTVQDYDAAHGETFTLYIHDALKHARHLIVLHTAGYDLTPWTRQERGQFLAAPDAQTAQRRICVLR